MAMLKLWLTDNSFKYVQLNDVVSFNVVRKGNEVIIEIETFRELASHYRKQRYTSKIDIPENCQDEKMAKLTQFLDEIFISNSLLIEIPNIFFKGV